MGTDIITDAFPFLLIMMSLYILFEMIRINIILKMWEIKNLMLIPIAIMVLYFWIGVSRPDIEDARLATRFVLSFSSAIGMYVTYSYSKFIRGGGK